MACSRWMQLALVKHTYPRQEPKVFAGSQGQSTPRPTRKEGESIILSKLTRHSTQFSQSKFNASNPGGTLPCVSVNPALQTDETSMMSTMLGHFLFTLKTRFVFSMHVGTEVSYGRESHWPRSPEQACNQTRLGRMIAASRGKQLTLPPNPKVGVNDFGLCGGAPHTPKQNR